VIDFNKKYVTVSMGCISEKYICPICKGYKMREIVQVFVAGSSEVFGCPITLHLTKEDAEKYISQFPVGAKYSIECIDAVRNEDGSYQLISTDKMVAVKENDIEFYMSSWVKAENCVDPNCKVTKIEE